MRLCGSTPPSAATLAAQVGAVMVIFLLAGCSSGASALGASPGSTAGTTPSVHASVPDLLTASQACALMAGTWPALSTATKDQRLDHADALSDFEFFTQIYDGLETQADPDNTLESDVDSLANYLGTIAEADVAYATSETPGLDAALSDDLGSATGAVQTDCQTATADA